MEEYHKIQTVYKRDPETKFRTLLEGQYATPEIEYLADKEWLWEEKIDGTNIRIMWQDGKVLFGGKTDNAEIPARLLKKLQELFPVEKFKAKFPDHDACLYGEGFGTKIQSGGNYIKDGVDFALFDVKIGKFWLKRSDVWDVSGFFVIHNVSEVGSGSLSSAIEFVRNGRNASLFGSFQAEGLVMRPAVDLFDRAGHRIITKIKRKDFSQIVQR